MAKQSQEKLPRFEIEVFSPAAVVFKRALHALDPPTHRSVADCALVHRVLENPGGGYSGPWLHERAPWTVGPMEALSSGLYNLVIVQGCSQGGKSEIGNNWLLWSVVDNPANMILLNPTKEMMRDWVVSRIHPMLRLSAAMRERQRDEPSADNIFSKRFRGCDVWFTWPVADQLSARAAPRWWIDDADQVPEDVDGQGSPESLLTARQTTFEGRDMGLKTGSPALGRGRGIEADFLRGTRFTWRWPCPGCGEYFKPRKEQLDFKRNGTPEEARASVVLICPTNGCAIEHKQKRTMNRYGTWAGPKQTVEPDGSLIGDAPGGRIASFHIHGLFGFSSWGRLAELWRTAEITWEKRQDESKLRAFFNTRLGENYTSQVANQEPLEVTALEERRNKATFSIGEIPAGVVCLDAAVDVQGNRFEIAVLGWGEGLESWLIDRFAIYTEADGRTKLNPAIHPEQWLLLLDQVFWKRYRAANGVLVPILTTAIDTGGVAGVSDNATKFWYAARRAGVPDTAITLVKGSGNLNAKLLSKTYLEQNRRGQPLKGGASLRVLNTNAWKDIIDARLRRETPGPGYMHLPADLPDDYLEELTSEEKQGRYWVKVRARNETFDLVYYAAAALARHAGERSDMRWVPQAYRAPSGATDEQTGIAVAPPQDHPQAAVKPRSRQRRRAVSSWIG